MKYFWTYYFGSSTPQLGGDFPAYAYIIFPEFVFRLKNEKYSGLGLYFSPKIYFIIHEIIEQAHVWVPVAEPASSFFSISVGIYYTY